jgi:hypothetical protein
LASTPAATGGQRQVVASNSMHWQWVQSESSMGNIDISRLQDFLGALSHSLILSSLMHPLQNKGAVRVLFMLFSSSISPHGVV